MPDPLSEDQVQAALPQGWSVADAKLHREFEFANFVAAFGFMTQSRQP